MEKVKSFNVAKAIELLRKTNQPRVDVKKKTKFDNMLELFNELIVQDGRCIIYQRKAFAKIIGVSEATFRNYLTKLGVDKFKLMDVVVNGKDGEEVVMIGTDKVAKSNDKNVNELHSDSENPIDKPDESTAEQAVENVEEVKLPTPTVKKTGVKKTQPQLRTDTKQTAKSEQANDAPETPRTLKM